MDFPGTGGRSRLLWSKTLRSIASGLRLLATGAGAGVSWAGWDCLCIEARGWIGRMGLKTLSTSMREMTSFVSLLTSRTLPSSACSSRVERVAWDDDDDWPVGASREEDDVAEGRAGKKEVEEGLSVTGGDEAVAERRAGTRETEDVLSATGSDAVELLDDAAERCSFLSRGGATGSDDADAACAGAGAAAAGSVEEAMGLIASSWLLGGWAGWAGSTGAVGKAEGTSTTWRSSLWPPPTATGPTAATSGPGAAAC